MDHQMSVLPPLLPPSSGISSPPILPLPTGTGGSEGALNNGRDGVPLCLLVRHFPHWLGREEKESLMVHFGAREVVVMPTKGKMRNCVFAMFSNSDDSKRAMNKLHQLNVFGCRLVVEYARPLHVKMVQEAELDRWACNTSKLPETPQDSDKLPPLPPTEPEHAPKPPPTHTPRYLYPPPNPTVINNITNAIACVPNLYVQVLDIMNKMNLPPPFGPPTPTPPMVRSGGIVTSIEGTGHSREVGENEEEEEGSEIDSDEDTRKKLTARSEHAHREAKRRTVSYKDMKSLLPPAKKMKRRESGEDEELQRIVKPRGKIEVHVPSEITPSRMTAAATELPEVTPTISLIGGTASSNRPDKSDSIQPDTEQSVVDREKGDQCLRDDEEESEDDSMEGERFITFAELMSSKLSEAEMKEEHVFKNYSPGEPSVRLYVKNLTKHVNEQELRYIFGRYVNWASENEKNMFDIRLMTSGRMKGQAFVGLPSEEAASIALKETNGYTLHGRPMIVHFARSSRPKETAS